MDTLEQIPPPDPTSARTLTVETRRLTRQYGPFVAVNDVSLEIEPGGIYGFIGPNGAGKTTTMRILATLLEPSSGDAWVCGLSVRDRSVENLRALRATVGYMPDFIGTYDRTTAYEYLDFFAAAYFVEAKRRANLINDLLQLVDLTAKRDTYIDGLSRGMTQRLALARTLIHDPRLLLLDEPASGLDPRARVELRELLKELSRMGKTIIISSHILTELTEMCSHIGIIERGRLLATGRVSDILGSLNQHLRIVRLKLGPLNTDNSIIQNFLATGPNVRCVKPLETAGEWEVQVEGNEPELHALLRYYIGRNAPIYSFSEQPVNLEDAFLRITKGYVA